MPVLVAIGKSLSITLTFPFPNLFSRNSFPVLHVNPYISSSNTSIENGWCTDLLAKVITVCLPVPSKFIADIWCCFVSAQYNRLAGRSTARPVGHSSRSVMNLVASFPSIFARHIAGLAPQSVQYIFLRKSKLVTNLDKHSYSARC